MSDEPSELGMEYADKLNMKGGEPSMRRKAAVALVAILVGLSFAGVAFATHTITGEVVSVDRSAQTLMISVEGPVMTFSVMEEATKALDKLEPGDKVTVSYSHTYIEPERKLIAQSIAKLPVGG